MVCNFLSVQPEVLFEVNKFIYILLAAYEWRVTSHCMHLLVCIKTWVNVECVALCFDHFFPSVPFICFPALLVKWLCA